MGETSRVVDATDAIERTFRAQADRLWRALVLFSGEPEVAGPTAHHSLGVEAVDATTYHPLEDYHEMRHAAIVSLTALACVLGVPLAHGHPTTNFNACVRPTGVRGSRAVTVSS